MVNKKVILKVLELEGVYKFVACIVKLKPEAHSVPYKGNCHSALSCEVVKGH